MMQANARAMAMMPVQLDVKVIEAKLTRDTEFFGKMSPFVQLELGC